MAADADYLELSATELSHLSRLHDLLAPERGRIVEDFYAFLLARPELARLLPGGDGLERLKRLQGGYFESLTAGERDAAYVDGRRSLGRTHQRIGLAPGWYLASYWKYLSLMLEHAARADGGASARFLGTVDSLIKAVFFDLRLVLEAHFREIWEAVERARAASEARYRMLYEMAPLGIARVASDGRIVGANRRLCAMLGLEKSELLRRGLGQLVARDQAEDAAIALQALFSGSDGKHSQVYRLVRGAGTIHARATASLAEGDAPSEAFTVWMFEDVTEAREQRLRLEESEAMYRSVFESAAAGILVLEDGICIDHNPGATELLGGARASLLGMPFVGLIGPAADREDAVDRLRRTLQEALSGAPQRTELSLQRPDDIEVEVEAHFSRLDIAGVALVQVILHDIGRRRQAERAVQLMNETLEHRVRERTRALEQSNRELDAFSYSVSHDLRSPLRAISRCGALLRQRAGTDAESGEQLDRLDAATGRMGRMLDDLLRLARFSRTPLTIRRVDLSAMAAEVARETRPERAGRARVTIQPGLSAHGDEGLLRHVLENLFSNAWKYTSRRAEPAIEFGREAGGERAYFLRDNGAGFDMAYAGKLFQPFQRLHGSHEFPGEGIGLATLRRIVERHGGRAWASAAPDQGACFYFTLGAAATP